MRILLAVDSRPEAARVVVTAHDMFGPTHDYTFVNVARHVSPTTARSVGTPRELAAIRRAMRQDALAQAERNIAVAAEAVNISYAGTEVAIGDAGESLCRLAKSTNADVIVVGHREPNFWERLTRRSVGRYLISNAPCPVLVIR